MKKVYFVIIFVMLVTYANSELIFFDDFEAGLGNWNVINNGGVGLWTIYSPPYPNSYTMPPTSSGNVCSADSDEAGSGTTTDTTLELATPIDMSTYTDIILEFDSDFYAINTDDYCYVDVSSDGGSTWNNVLTYAGVSVRQTHETLDITEFVELQSNVLVRFHSVQPGWDWWWTIDNIEINAEISIIYDNNLAALSIAGSTIVNAGNTENYEITIKNVGNNPQDEYSVTLKKENGEILSTVDVNQTIEPQEVVTYILTWNVPSDEPEGSVNIFGEVFLEGDENPANNITGYLSVQVFPQGIFEITVGDGTELNNRTPVCFQYLNSLTEMLYFSEELGGVTGMITALTFYNDFTTNLMHKPVQVWMGETTQTNLTDGWIPSTSLTQVFDGFVNFPAGNSFVTINLDFPYMYEGDNLVLMVFRPMDSQVYGSLDNFYHDETLEMLDRTRYERDDVIVLDPANPPEGWGFEKFPNTTFTFYQGAMGDIEGYVIDNENNPIGNAEILIEETQATSYSDAAGFYHFGNILIGNYFLTASAFGYSPQTIQAEVLENDTTEVNFNLIPLGQVTVSGHVVGSDFPETGLEGATVTLTGFENYEVITDGNGDFEIPDVYTNIAYEMNITHDIYETYTEDVFVEGQNLDLGTIILNEITMPPGNLQALQNQDETEVDLTWNMPGIGLSEFRYDDDNLFSQIGFSNTPTNAVFGASHLHNAVVQEVHWLLTSTWGSHTQAKIFIFGLDNEGLPDSNQLLHQSNLLPNIDNEWNTYILAESVNAPDGFFIGVNTPGIYTGIGLDDGIDEPWEFVQGTQMAIENWSSGEWLDIGDIDPQFQKNMMIRAYGIDFGNIDRNIKYNQTERIAKHVITDSLFDRQFESFNVYRFNEFDHDDPDNWDLIAQAVTDTFYTDTEWAPLPIGMYQFAVTSVHTNNVESVPAFSNTVYKTTVYVEDNDLNEFAAELKQNIPNPFSSQTTIYFNISSQQEEQTIEIYNIKGQKVRTLECVNYVDAKATESLSHIIWDGKDDSGKPVNSGIYFYKLKSGKFSSTKKMILIR